MLRQISNKSFVDPDFFVAYKVSVCGPERCEPLDKNPILHHRAVRIASIHGMALGLVTNQEGEERPKTVPLFFCFHPWLKFSVSLVLLPSDQILSSVGPPSSGFEPVQPCMWR